MWAGHTAARQHVPADEVCCCTLPRKFRSWKVIGILANYVRTCLLACAGELSAASQLEQAYGTLHLCRSLLSSCSTCRRPA